MIEQDLFIGRILGKAAWRVLSPSKLDREVFRNGSDSFAYAKVDSIDIQGIKLLEEIGFNLVDANMQFERLPQAEWPQVELEDGYGVRVAESIDVKAVAGIAASTFVYTRFHLDPLVPNQVASDIKRDWAANFFKGKRGDLMIVATFNGEIVGFNQLLYRDGVLIVDLIAVASEHQGKGLATAMIQYAAENCRGWQRMLVGTQISNIPSMRTYEKLGFRMNDSSYVFHYHGPIRPTI